MTENSNKSGEFEEGYFSHLSDAPFFDEKYREEYSLILKSLAPKQEDTILDMGCGKGQLGLFLLHTEPGSKMTFSDVSSQSGQYLSDHKFVQCSMDSTPFLNESFDKIYSLSTISHVPEIDKAIREMHRIAKGDILITTNNKWCVYLYRAASFLHLIPKFQYDKTVRHLYSSITLKRLLSRNGWKVKKVLHYGKYPSSKLKFDFLKTRLMIVASK